MPRWMLPVVYLIVSLVAAAVVPRIEYRLLPASGDEISVSTAQALLGAVASGLMAFTAIVFSIAFLLIQYTATASSKRFVLLLARKPVIFHAFGVFVATFTFALGTLAFVNRHGSQWVPIGSILIVAALLAVSMGLLAALIHQVADLRITRMLDYIGSIGRDVLRATPEPGGSFRDETLPKGVPAQVVRHRGNMAVLRKIDTARLICLARDSGATIELLATVGDAIFPDGTVARIYGGTVSEAALLGSLKFARENFYDNDVRFSLRLLVDTAIMALSPAVNDPTTAVEALDQIEDLLRRLGKRSLDSGRFADERGDLRLVYPTPSWDDYLALALDEIGQYGADSLQVVRRLRTALQRLHDELPEERRFALAPFRRRLDDDVGRRGYDEQRRGIASAIDPQGLGSTR